MPDASRRQLRKFGLMVGGTLAVIGSVSWWRGHEIPPRVLWTLGALLVVPGLVAPALLGPVERAWMRAARGLAYVNTRIILTVLFYVVMLPTGALRRLFGDPLNRKLGDGRPSNWIKRERQPVDPARYRMQF